MSSYDTMGSIHFDESASHRKFMQVVYQINNIACLLEQITDGSFLLNMLHHHLLS